MKPSKGIDAVLRLRQCTVVSHANCSQVVSSQVSVSRCPLRARSTARRDTFWAKLEATEESRCLAWPRPFEGQLGQLAEAWEGGSSVSSASGIDAPILRP